MTAPDGRELSVRIAAPGELLGETAVLDGGPRSADATAIEPSEVAHLSRADFDAFCDRHPIVLRRAIEFLCRRLRETTDQLEAVALLPIETRLARFLLAALAGREAADGRRVPLELGYSQTELAQLLGASRPKVNTALGRLEALSAIRRTSDRIWCDPARLARLAESGDG